MANVDSPNGLREVHLEYYAVLREQRGCAEEDIRTHAATVAELYEALRREHGFTVNPALLRAVVNTEFAAWDTPIQSGDTVVFIPPVAGG